MAEENTIKQNPEFDSDGSIQKKEGEEEVEESSTDATTEEEVVEEKETPTEPPAEEQPAEEKTSDDDTGALETQVQGLQEEKSKLIQEVVELRGTKRELKVETPATPVVQEETKPSDLTDVNPEDAALIDKVLRSKGYVTKEEAGKMLYENVKTEQLSKFLQTHPEYKPENDPNDRNWNSLQKELSLYKLPSDAAQLQDILERAHKGVPKASSEQGTAAKKQQIQTAGVGGGGTQSSSSGKSLTQAQRRAYEDGGWSEEEIQKLEKNLKD